MSTTVTFTGNLTEAPELLYIRENKPSVNRRLLVNRRVQNVEGEWVDDEPTADNVQIFGSAATPGDLIFVRGLESLVRFSPVCLPGQLSDVVVVDNRFGWVDLSLKYVSARIERTTRPAQAS